MVPLRDDKFKLDEYPEALPKTTYASPVLLSWLGAPMIISSYPSLLISPAELTESPLSSPAATPLITNPVVPLRDDKSKLDEYPEALPKTT